LQYAKSKVKENHVRLFQSIRHQGSEQVSKPDIHHVDFSLTAEMQEGKVESLPLSVSASEVSLSVVNAVVIVERH
jgi:hypothetical protein